MPNPQATRDQLPERIYKGSDKLKGKKAIITGGDSGIGAATALLFAREGADVTIAHLPEEEQDAQDTKNQVENEGAKCHLIALDLVERQNCQRVVDFALEKMGGIDILFNNAACKFTQVPATGGKIPRRLTLL